MTIAQQRRFRDRLLKQIGRRSVAGDTAIGSNLLMRERERYLSSHAVQSSVSYDIWRREHGLADAQQRWALAQQHPICPYNYRRFRSSPVPFFHKARTTTGVRKICCFNDLGKMWHVIARDLIVAQHQPRSHIGDWVGRGRDWQIDQIRAVLTSPHQGVVCADITRAFASVNIDAAYEIPYLPEPMIRRAIDYRSHRFVRRERSEHARDVVLVVRNDDVDLERSPSGLMEGSPASNAIFSVLIDDLPDQLGEGIHAFAYCDNIVLIAPSMSRALRSREVLVRYLTDHRAGPFEIRSVVTPAHQHFEHLGYSIRQRDGSPPEIGLSISAHNKLGARIENQQSSPEEIMAWLRASFRRCSSELMDTYFQRIVDEVGFRPHSVG